MLASAGVCAPTMAVEAMDYFEVAPPLDHDTFLGISNEVLQSTLLILAPFGLPRYLLMYRTDNETTVMFLKY